MLGLLVGTGAAFGTRKLLASPLSCNRPGWKLSAHEFAVANRLLAGSNALSDAASLYRTQHWPQSEEAQGNLLRTLHLQDEVLPPLSRKLAPAPRPQLRAQPLLGPTRSKEGQMNVYRLTLTDGQRSSDILLRVPVAPDPRFALPTLEEVVWSLTCLDGPSARQLKGVTLSPQPSPADLIALGRTGLLPQYNKATTSDGGQLTVWALPPPLEGRVELAKSLFHECAHPFSFSRFDVRGVAGIAAQRSPAWAIWEKAMADDGIVLSRYARDTQLPRKERQPAEDFAETVGLFRACAADPRLLAEFRALVPNRTRQLDELLPVLMTELKEQSGFTLT